MVGIQLEPGFRPVPNGDYHWSVYLIFGNILILQKRYE